MNSIRMYITFNCNPILLSGFSTNHFHKSIAKMSRLFYQHGRFCACHPWEVMVVFLTLSICMFSMAPSFSPSNNPSINMMTSGSRRLFEESELVILTISRCLALLYIYHQFRNLYKLGSKYLVGISVLFTVFSSFLFITGVINFLNGNFTELNKALPFFFLLSDLSKASLLAQFALASFSREEVRENIARGMSILGPSMTLDTIVETLAIGVGTLSGVTRLEEISCFACLSVLVNYVVFMTFFPACLSLALELSHTQDGNTPVWQLSSIGKVLQLEEQTPNPVIQRVKMIMSAGLMIVHTMSRWSNFRDNESNLNGNLSDISNEPLNVDNFNTFSQREPTMLELILRRIFAVGSEQVIMLGLVCALAIKYIFFENRDLNNEHFYANANHFTSGGNNSNDGESQSRQRSCNANNNDNNVCYKSDSLVRPNITVTCHDSSDTESLIHENIQENKSSRASSTKSDQEGEDGKKSPAFFIGDDSSSDFSETDTIDRGCQTDEGNETSEMQLDNESIDENVQPRDLKTLVEIMSNSNYSLKTLTDIEVKLLTERGHLNAHNLENVLDDPKRGVKIRREIIGTKVSNEKPFNKIPYLNYDYTLVNGACCENVIGYMPLPLGVAGPLLLNGDNHYIPMATTEGCLVASTNRGCSALRKSGGVKSRLFSDGMTRGPVIRFPSAMRAAEANDWIKEEANFALLKEAFDSTSRFARLNRIHCRVAGKYLYMRFEAATGDAMGMNMLSKGTEKAIEELRSKHFPDIEMTCLSGNFCTDKKSAAVNWIEGRGKSVVCEAVIPAHIVVQTLKTSVEALVEVNISKNFIGSAMAGSIGGFNAQAANIVTAIYIATGQDPAQVVGSANCITIMEATGPDKKDLYISCTMPSIECGTVGGGTVLGPQSACLELMGVKGACVENPGANSCQFASLVCGSVLAGELSLLSALAAGQLVKSHMTHNRSSVNMAASAHGYSQSNSSFNSKSTPSGPFLSLAKRDFPCISQ